jgi:hypothetical protein
MNLEISTIFISLEFFLEHVGELRIFILRRIRGPRGPTVQTITRTSTTNNHSPEPKGNEQNYKHITKVQTKLRAIDCLVPWPPPCTIN